VRSRWVVIAMVFLIACQPVIVQQNTTINATCNLPYREYTPGDCCLDANADGVCDREQTQLTGAAVVEVPPVEQQPVKQAPSQTAINDAIIKFRKKVSNYSYLQDDTLYLVSDKLVRIKPGSIIHVKIRVNDILASITDIYIDRAKQQAIGYCDPRTEPELKSFADRSACVKLINTPIPLPYAEYNPVLPEDWLLRFEHSIPVRVETAEQYVKQLTGWRLVTPVITVLDGQNNVILYIDAKTGLPVKIETPHDNTKNVTEYARLLSNGVKADEIVYQPITS
jgi:hypothetical protein